MKTAAVLLVGDEILAGKFQDENGVYAIARFRECGVSLKHLAVIPDDVDVIASEVARCSAAYDIVVTSGGVGPTHDDMTLQGIAGAFGLALHPHPELVEAIEAFGWELTPAVMRMVQVPEGTELNWLDGVKYPAIQVRNVTVLPGVPSIFKMKFDALLPGWSSTPILTHQIYVTERESAIAQRLLEISQHHPAVSIGSYPRFEAREYRVIVTLEGEDPGALRTARAAIEGCMKTVKPQAD